MMSMTIIPKTSHIDNLLLPGFVAAGRHLQDWEQAFLHCNQVIMMVMMIIWWCDDDDIRWCSDMLICCSLCHCVTVLWYQDWEQAFLHCNYMTNALYEEDVCRCDDVIIAPFQVWGQWESFLWRREWCAWVLQGGAFKSRHSTSGKGKAQDKDKGYYP